MKEFTQGLQLVAFALLGVAAIPLTMNQCAEMDARKRYEARAAHHAVLGQAALEAKDPALAAAAYAQALGYAPFDAASRKGLLGAHVEQVLADGQGITANNVLQLQTELADAMLEGEVDARTTLAYGRVLQFRGKSDDARAQFRKAIEADADQPLAHLLLGDALLKAGEYDAAAAALDRSLELDPQQPLAEFALGQVRVQQEKWDDAAKLLESASRSVHNPQLYTALGRAQVERQKWEEAQKALERAIALDPAQTVAYALLGDTYLKTNRVEAAVKAFEASWERARDVESLRKLARLHQGMQAWERAGELFGQLRLLLPDDPEPHCGIGTAADNMGQMELAVGAYGKCAELAQKRPDQAELAQRALLRVAAIQKEHMKAPEKGDKKDDKKGDKKRGDQPK